MNLIKLDAIDSTNSFLKELASNTSLEDYTVVVTNKQTKGRGQMQNTWASKPFKNLTFSVFKSLKNLEIRHQSYLNFAVSLAIYDTLKSLSVPKLFIKWPNDIMADNKKVCGILIETTFNNSQIKNTIIGIGLNVNQEKFSKDYPNASSLKLILNRDLNLDELLHKIVERCKFYIKRIEQQDFEEIHNLYNETLYKKEIPSTFFNTKSQQYFMGIISHVNQKGKLIIQLEDDSLKEFDNKEVTFAIT